MISTSISRILLITIFCFSTLVSADHSVKKSDSPYQGNVVVGSLNETQLKNRALQQVLVKVSGNADIASRPETKRLLQKTQQLISQYGTRQIQGVEYFSAIFDQDKINQALKDMQQAVWGDRRPTTLIWLVNNGEIVSDNAVKQYTDRTLSIAFQNTQQQRGIHVQFPLMDLDDNIALSTSDIKGRFYEQVSDASARYQRAHYVTADLQPASSGRWKLSWQLLKLDATRSLLSDQFVGSKAAVTEKMVNALADYYAGQYAILENQGDKYTQVIEIDGINSLEQLAQLHNIMSNMLAISSYNIVAVKDELVSVEVKLKGSVESFKNTLSVEPHLQLNSNSSDNIDNFENSIVESTLNTDTLYFNWRH